MKGINRNIQLDILRIIAGIAVVMIHVSDPFVNLITIFGGLSWWTANIINSFSRVSVPLFVMISGSLLLMDHNKDLPILVFLKKRLLRIVIPLLFWSVFYLVIWRLNYLNPEIVLTAYASGKLEHLYFLIIMIGLYIITPVLLVFNDHATENQKKYFIAITFGFSILLGLFHRILPKINYEANALNMFVPYICFYFAGAYFINIKSEKKQLSKYSIIFLGLGIFNAILNYGSAVLDRNNIPILFSHGMAQYVYEAYSPLIIVMTILIFISVLSLKLSEKYNSLLVHVSSTVFGIYLIHPFIIYCIDKYLGLGIDKLVSPLWMYMFFKMILVFIISYIIVIAGKKIPYVRYIFGYTHRS
ncbi:acyltransferase family protein [soil metagenome]